MIVLFALKQKKGGKFTKVGPNKLHFGGSILTTTNADVASEEAQQRYRRRGRIVDFCHAWIKSKLGPRQFHVGGLAKTQE